MPGRNVQQISEELTDGGNSPETRNEAESGGCIGHTWRSSGLAKGQSEACVSEQADG